MLTKLYNCFIFTALFVVGIFPAQAQNNDPTSFYRNFDGISLKDQNNHAFSPTQLDAKISLFNFIYTNCNSVCSTQTKELAHIYAALSPEIKKDVRFISVSLDPIKDNPKKLKKFAANLKADVDGWYFLSTHFQALNLLTTKISLFKEDHGKTVYDTLTPIKKKQPYKLEEHATGLWLIDYQGHIRQRYVGNPIEVKRVVDEITTLHSMQFKS